MCSKPLFVRRYLFSKTNGAAPSVSFPPIPAITPLIHPRFVEKGVAADYA